MFNSQNPMLGPSLRNNAVSQALNTILEAIRITNLPKDSPVSMNRTNSSEVVGDAVVILKNQSPADICFYVEFSSGNFPLPHMCNFDHEVLPGQKEGIIVPAHSIRKVFTGANFNGPFNTVVNGANGTIDGKPAMINGTRGARHEINYADDSNGIWYDVDYEFGLSNGTLAPSDGRPNTNGMPSVTGETNILAKSNDAWQNLTAMEKWELIGYTKYIGVENKYPGNLTRLYHDKQAPAVVNFFYQMTVGLQGYVVFGSDPKFSFATGSLEEQMVPVADSFAWHVEGPQNMTITAY